MDNYIYIVSGLKRSGTSMMMKALINGGMEAVYDPEQDEYGSKQTPQIYKGQEYFINPGGFYEFSPEKAMDEEWVKACKGKVIKNLLPGVLNFLVPEKTSLKVIMMYRDVQEIETSWKISNVDMKDFIEVGLSLTYYDEFMSQAVDFLRTNKKADVIMLHYKDIIDKPKKEFRKLRDSGWPINPKQASMVVTPTLYRIRRENI